MEQRYFKKMVNCPLHGGLREHTACISCPLNKGKTDDFVWCNFFERIGLKDREK